MPGKVILENIRNVGRLEFEIPDRGVWLLTAGNGGGKSSLLACLRRLGYRQAFPVHFPTSQRSERLDNFDNARITYEINDESVTYSYSGIRWVPIPKKNSQIFDRFGYSDVVYIGATADRISPRPGDFDTGRVQRAAPYVVQNANRIFDTDRYSLLRSVNLTRGGWNRAYVMAHDDNPRTYHSENHFSMGELCVLNLLQQINECRNNSLLLIDELELAIHPKAQRNLLDYLIEEARRKGLTVIFSTHSVTLLKAARRKSIILLSRVGGNVEPMYGCFPALALGYLADTEERIADSFIYVEDEAAAYAVEPLVKLAIREKYDRMEAFPTVSIVPIGPFSAVMRFMRGGAAMLPDHVMQHALLDEDVQSETLARWQARGNAVRLAEFQQIRDRTSFLPWVPEVLACRELYSQVAYYQQELRRELMTARVGINRGSYAFVNQLQGVDLRNEAKRIYEEFVDHLIAVSGKTEPEVKALLFKVIAEKAYSDEPGTYNALLGPMI